MSEERDVANERSLLIAKKYTKGLTLKEESRLEVLDKRIRELVPAVTRAQWQAIEKCTKEKARRSWARSTGL